MGTLLLKLKRTLLLLTALALSDRAIEESLLLLILPSVACSLLMLSLLLLGEGDQ
jgi:hypothetical protein